MQLTTYLSELVKSQMKQKIDLEQTLDNRLKFLASPSTQNVGLNGKLVDDEGYPLPNIDIKAICQARQDVHKTKNDLKEIMKEIRLNIIKLHQSFRNHSNIQSGNSLANTTDFQDIVIDSEEDTNSHYDQEINILSTEALSIATRSLESMQTSIPILLVTHVEPETPASHAGLIEGDKILSIGQFDDSTFISIDQITNYLHSSNDEDIECKFMRDDQVNLITLSRSARNQSLGMTIEPYANN